MRRGRASTGQEGNAGAQSSSRDVVLEDPGQLGLPELRVLTELSESGHADTAWTRGEAVRTVMD